MKTTKGAVLTPRNIKLCILCLIATAANWALSFLVENRLGLPLFMDTLFTIALTFAAGPLWGIITAVLTTAFIGYLYYQFWGTYLYVLCTIAAVLLTWVFCRRFKLVPFPEPAGQSTWFIRVISILLILSIVMCVLISVLGGIIAFIISGVLNVPEYAISPDFFFRLGLLRHNIPVLAADILARIPINIVDRPITVFGAYGLSLLLRKITV
jgi:hypothetical protein